MTFSAPSESGLLFAAEFVKLLPQSADNLASNLHLWGVVMQAVVQSYQGLSLIVGLNWDRLFFLGTIVVGLLAGAFLGSALTHP